MLYCLKVVSQREYVDYEGRYTIFDSKDFSIKKYTQREVVDLYINSKDIGSIRGLKWDNYGFGKDISYMFSLGAKTAYLMYKRLNNWFLVLSKNDILDVYYNNGKKSAHIAITYTGLTRDLGLCIYKPNTYELYLSEGTEGKSFSGDLDTYRGIIHIKYDKELDNIIYYRYKVESTNLYRQRIMLENQRNYRFPGFFTYLKQDIVNDNICYFFYNQLSDSYIRYDIVKDEYYDNADNKPLIMGSHIVGKPLTIMRPLCINHLEIKKLIDSYIKNCKSFDNSVFDRDAVLGNHLYYKSMSIIFNYILSKDEKIVYQQKHMTRKLHSVGYILVVEAASHDMDANLVLKELVASTKSYDGMVRWFDGETMRLV